MYRTDWPEVRISFLNILPAPLPAVWPSSKATPTPMYPSLPAHFAHRNLWFTVKAFVSLKSVHPQRAWPAHFCPVLILKRRWTRDSVLIFVTETLQRRLLFLAESYASF